VVGFNRDLPVSYLRGILSACCPASAASPGSPLRLRHPRPPLAAARSAVAAPAPPRMAGRSRRPARCSLLARAVLEPHSPALPCRPARCSPMRSGRAAPPRLPAVLATPRTHARRRRASTPRSAPVAQYRRRWPVARRDSCVVWIRFHCFRLMCGVFTVGPLVWAAGSLLCGRLSL